MNKKNGDVDKKIEQENFFEMNPIAIVKFDRQCRILNANQIARLLFFRVNKNQENPFLANLDAMCSTPFFGNMTVFDREIIFNDKTYEQTIFCTDASFLYSYIVDITKKKQYEKKLEELAHFDVLTGLPNRLALMDHVISSISRALRHKKSRALLYVDFDQFKKVNDSFGHSVGDLLLVEIGKRLKLHLRKGDYIARMGGDEFVIFLEDIRNSQDAANIARNIISSFQKPFLAQQYEFFTTCSIGISTYNAGDTITTEQLIQYADMAMYEAKKHGKNQYQFYDDKMNLVAKRYMELENRLHHAINCQELHLNYQGHLMKPSPAAQFLQ